MAEWATQGDGQAFETAGAVAAASGGTAVTCGAINTKGSYAELVAATAQNAAGVLLCIRNADPTNAIYALVDLAVGAAASEQVVVANLHFAGRLATGGALFVPLAIPAGSRLAARAQATVASVVLEVTATLVAQGFVGMPPLARVSTYGAATGDSGGVLVDPGGTAHTDSAWVELVASCDPVRALVLTAFESAALFSLSNASWLVDIGVGAAASEQVLVADLLFAGDSATDMVYPQYVGPLPCAIPAGTRIAARARCSIIDANDRRLEIIAYGVS